MPANPSVPPSVLSSVPPEQARRFQRVRWTIYAILTISFMLVFFHRMAPAVVSADLMAAFNTTGAALGSLAAMYYYVYTAMQLPTGVLADTVGARAMVSWGNLVAGLGSILFGVAGSMELAMAGRFLVGLGVSVIFIGLMKSNTAWFSERVYGLLSGLTLLFGNLGAVLAAGPLALLLGHVSWRAAFVGIGIFSVLLAALSWLLVRNRPEDAGFAGLQPAGAAGAAAGASVHWLQAMRQVWTDRGVWPGFWFNFGMAGSLFSFIGLWGIPLLRDVHGLSRDRASVYTTLTLLALACSTLLLGWLSDRLGTRKRVMAGSALLYLLVCLVLLFWPWQAGAGGMLLFVLMGLCGSGFVLSYACAKEVCDPALSGMAISVVNTGLFLGAALVQTAFGWVLDLGWDGSMQEGVRVYSVDNYRTALWLMPAGALMALVAAWRMLETGCRNISAERCRPVRL